MAELADLADVAMDLIVALVKKRISTKMQFLPGTDDKLALFIK